MAQRRWAWIGVTHPAVMFTAAGLLIGGTFSDMLRTARHPDRGTSLPAARASVVMGSLPPPADRPGVLAGPPAPMLASPQQAPEGAGAASAPPLPAAHFPLPPAPVLGPPAPVHGPEWKQAPLPAVSPEVLQAMLNPRAVRRARHLRRLGLIPAPEPAATASLPVAAALPKETSRSPGKKADVRGAKLAAARMKQTTSSSLPANGAAEHPAPTTLAKLDPPAPAGSGPLPAGATGTGPGGEPAAAQPAPSVNGAHDAKPAGDTSATASAVGKGAVSGAAPATISQSPIWLRARLDHPRPEYQVGEWVAVRFLASQPVHLRVYRVDAAGRVTRVFSTYGKDEQGRPARTFSMMVKAGQPRPGPEGMVAIGSARPLTRGELLACLHAYLSESPFDGVAPSGSSEADRSVTGAAPPPAAPVAPGDALKAVIAAVEGAADLPEAAAAPLDRSAWSIAIGRFTSADRKLSAVGSPSPAKAAAEGS